MLLELLLSVVTYSHHKIIQELGHTREQKQQSHVNYLMLTGQRDGYRNGSPIFPNYLKLLIFFLLQKV